MILFASDYQRYPNAIIDTSTSNASFLQLAAKYQKSGVKNAGMILTLLNPTLRGLDPFSPSLTPEQKVAITTEASSNIWYYLREVVRLPPSAGVEPIRFRANRSNIAISWLSSLNVDFILVQPRQTGKSVGVDCIMTRLLYLATFSTKISMVTKDNSLRTSNIERLKEIRNLLPPYMYVKDKADSDNKVGLTYNAKKCHYIASVAQMSEAAARNVGRGQTAAIFHIDEGPFIPYLDVLVPSALAAGTAAKAQAREQNQPHFTAFTTTAGKKDDRSGGFMYGMVEESIPWSETFFDLTDKVRFDEVIKKGCRGMARRVYCCFNHIQLGFSDEWLKRALSETGSKGEEADRDFFNRWTSGSLRSPLSVSLNTTISKSTRSPLYTEITKQGYQFRWFCEKDDIKDRLSSGNVVLSMDTSEAVGCDDIGIVLTDMSNLETVGAATINETNIMVFGLWVAGFLIRYDKVLFMIERKSTGSSIIDIVTMSLMEAGFNPFKRIYNTIVQERDSRPSDWSAINSSNVNKETVRMYRKYFGFITTAQNRHFLYSNTLQNNAKMGGSRVYDETLIGQITSLVTKNGRIDHTSSGHDDMVIAWLLSGWLAANGRNLSYYGVNPEECLSRVYDVKTVTLEDEYQQHKRDKIKAEIEGIRVRLEEATDPFVVLQLEHKLRALMRNADFEEATNMSIDGLIAKAEEARKLKAAAANNNRRIAKGTNRSGYSTGKRYVAMI